MKLAAKLVGVLVIALILIRVAEAVIAVRQESGLIDTDMHRDALLLGRTLRSPVQDAWARGGQEQALKLIEAANLEDHPTRIRWAWYDGRGGLRSWLDEASLQRLEAGEAFFVEGFDEHDEEQLSYLVPVEVEGGSPGVLELSESLANRNRYLTQMLLRKVLAGGLVILLSAVTVVVVGFHVVGRPLNRLRDQIRRIGEGDLRPLPVKGRDELASLAAGLNQMCDQLLAASEAARIEAEKRIAALDQLRHADRLTTIGRLAAGIAHELGTPLNVIGGRASLIAEGALPPDQVAPSAATIKAQADRMTNIIRNLLHFARLRPLRRATSNIGEVVRQTITLVECLGHTGTVQFTPPGDGVDMRAEVDAAQLEQVMMNLVDNGLAAMPDGGEVDISIYTVDASPPAGVDAVAGRYMRIDVADQGVGIPEENLPQLFDPFFTTKDVGKGTGLGLSIAYGIIREHGGWIEVASTVGRGSCFSVFIPQVNGDDGSGADRR